MSLSKKMETFAADEDWSKFKNANLDRLLNAEIPPVEIKNVIYDGCDDPAITSVREGVMLRKEGVIVKSYKPFHAILTQSGYFHLTSSITRDEKFPEVFELSLDLSECTLQPLMMNEKEPEEIALIEKKTGMFGGELKHRVFL